MYHRRNHRFRQHHCPGCREQHSKLIRTEKAKDAAEREVVKLRELVEMLDAQLAISRVELLASEELEVVATRAMKRERGG